MKNNVNSSLDYCKAKTTTDKQGAKPSFAKYCPDKCDLCSSNIKDFSYFADAIVPGYGKWGSLCQVCVEKRSVEFGPGLGQLFQKDENESGKTVWRRVAGHVDYPDEEHDIGDEEDDFYDDDTMEDL